MISNIEKFKWIKNYCMEITTTTFENRVKAFRDEAQHLCDKYDVDLSSIVRQYLGDITISFVTIRDRKNKENWDLLSECTKDYINNKKDFYGNNINWNQRN